MRTSAGLITLGLVLVAIQAAGSNGGPLRHALLSGQVVLIAGVLGLVAGIAIGATRGTRTLRAAMLLAILGATFVQFGLLFTPIGGMGRQPEISVNEVALLVRAAIWGDSTRRRLWVD